MESYVAFGIYCSFRNVVVHCNCLNTIDNRVINTLHLNYVLVFLVKEQI